MSWRASLVRIANHEVDTLRKRLAEILDRRAALEMKLVMLAAESEAEMGHIDRNPETAWLRVAFAQGVRVRRADIQAKIDAIDPEEAGARDALAEAFETLKKFERVEENARLADAKQAARLEGAAMDEIGLRKRAV